MKVIVPSVMHSGTHLVRFEVLKMFYSPDDEYECQFGHSSGNELIGFHTDEVRYKEQMENNPVIVPMRHPSRVSESWRRRGKSEGFDRQWLNLIHISQYNPYYVHVDHPRRDEQVENLGNVLGLNLHTDWPVSQRSGSRYGTHDIDLKDCPKAPQKYIDFYEATCL